MGEINELFRVKIILSHYFDDHKSKAYVSVNKQWKNVRQFHKHLEEIFGLTKFILTTNDEVYLPGKFHICVCQLHAMEFRLYIIEFNIIFSERKYQRHQ